MKNCKKHFVVTLFVLAFGLSLKPENARCQVIEVGASAGLSSYWGDINPWNPLNKSKLGVGLVVRYYDNVRWAFRFSYTNQTIAGSDKVSGYKPERGLSFSSKINDFALLAEFNFLNYFTGSKRSKFSPYLFGGLSVFTFNPKADDGTELCSLLTDVDYDSSIPENGKAKYSKTALSLPFGMGVKYSLGKKLGLTVEWRFHLAFTDWIDDCHAYYPTYTNAHDSFVHYSDPTGLTTDANNANDKKYVQRGNYSDYDWYGYLNVSLVYKFILPKKDKCYSGANRNSYVTY